MKKTFEANDTNTWDQLVSETLAALAERTATDYVRYMADLDIRRLDSLEDDPDAQVVYATYVHGSITQNCGQMVMASDVADAGDEVVDAHNRLVALGWLELREGAFYHIVGGQLLRGMFERRDPGQLFVTFSDDGTLALKEA